MDYILYTSPSTVNNMITLFGVDKIKEKNNIAIGPQTFKALKENNIDGYTCRKHSEEAFLEEIVEIYKSSKESKGEQND